MIVRDREAALTPGAIGGAIGEFLQQVHPRLEALAKAYAGQGRITQRVRRRGLPNNRLSHAYPRYIATMASGYLAGKPMTYEVQEEAQQPALDALMDAYKAARMDSVDAELAMNASVYGRAVCICYAGEDSRPKAAALDPRAAFVVYDDTVEHRPICGVHWLWHRDAQGRPDGVTAHVHTAQETILLRGGDLGALAQTGREAHRFGGVPMVEFWNNADETGDFEPVLSLIEAYDQLESDRVNDEQQFADAILLMTGCTLAADPAETRTPGQILLEEKTLELPEGAKVEWMVKNARHENAQELRRTLNEDIHKMSMVPDLTDEQFAGNASGVAIRYKLLGLEELTGIKERWFAEGLTGRMALFAHFLGVLGKPALDCARVKLTFTRGLPQNETETAAMVAQLTGIVSKATLLAKLPFVEDVDAELARLEADAEKDEARRARAFGGAYADANE